MQRKLLGRVTLGQCTMYNNRVSTLFFVTDTGKTGLWVEQAQPPDTGVCTICAAALQPAARQQHVSTRELLLSATWGCSWPPQHSNLMLTDSRQQRLSAPQ